MLKPRKILVLTIVLVLAAAAALAAELPRAYLDESERYFTRAYTSLINRDYWDALDNLDRALRLNTYLVDYYLLSSLALHSAGDSDGARQSMMNYLEVRPMDGAAPRIARNFIEQDRILRSVLGPRPVSVRWRLKEPDLQNELGLGNTRPFNIRGLGKADSLGGVICVADTLGSCLYIMPKGAGTFLPVSVQRPVTAIPMGDGSFTAFLEDGEVLSLSRPAGSAANAPFDAEKDVRPEGRVRSRIADAEWLSESEFAVADPVARNVAFYLRAELRVPDPAAQQDETAKPEDMTAEPLYVWAPPDAGMLFEPVALDRYAEWLAVADRGSGRVYVLRLPAAVSDNSFYVEVGPVRDVMWSQMGELFALTEKGEIFRIDVDFAERTMNASSPMWKGMDDAWSLFPAEGGDIYCMTVGGSKLYRGVMLPSQDFNSGFLGLYAPTVALGANREYFLVEGTLSAPFSGYLKNAGLSVQIIWNERTVRSSAWWRARPVFDGLLLHRRLPAGRSLPLNLRPASLESGTDMMAVLPALWSLHKNSITNVIVDSSVPFSQDDILRLVRFCLLNGLELDIWARETPSLALTRASAMTGGTTLFSLGNSAELQAPRTHIQIQIPLPSELSSSGYPGRSMLTVFLDAGLMQTRAWIPLWPDMLWK